MPLSNAGVDKAHPTRHPSSQWMKPKPERTRGREGRPQLRRPRRRHYCLYTSASYRREVEADLGFIRKFGFLSTAPQPIKLVGGVSDPQLVVSISASASPPSDDECRMAHVSRLRIRCRHPKGRTSRVKSHIPHTPPRAPKKHCAPVREKSFEAL